MNDENVTDKPTAEAAKEVPPQPAAKSPHPLQRILDHFIERVDSLADHMKLAMAAIAQSNKQETARFEEFLKTKATPVEGEKDSFTIPDQHLTEFRRIERQLRRSHLALVSVPRSFTVTLVSEFDAFMSAILKTFYHLKPDALNASERTMTFSELLEFESIDDARKHVIEKDVETFLRASHAEQFQTLEGKVGIPLRKDLPIWKYFIELTERRNLFVHNDGVVNRQYLQVCAAEGYDCAETKKGASLGVPKLYFAKAHETLYELAAKLTHVLWRKLSPDDRERADAHFAGTLIYDLLVDRRYRLARTLADFGADTFKKWGSDYFRRALIVNRAQAYIWDGNRDEGLRILGMEDWSAANDEFQLCVTSLQGDFERAVKIMRTLGQAERPGKEGYRAWPVFTELRREDIFRQAFEEVFNEPFATVKVSSAANVQPSESPAQEPTASPATLQSLAPVASDVSDEGMEPPKVH